MYAVRCKCRLPSFPGLLLLYAHLPLSDAEQVLVDGGLVLDADVAELQPEGGHLLVQLKEAGGRAPYALG